MKTKAQGAIEYLLMLAAAIVVVAIVISFMLTTIQPVTETGSKQTYDYTCKTLNTNSLLCGCYEKDITKPKGEVTNSGTHVMANKDNCPELLPDKYKSDPLLNWQ